MILFLDFDGVLHPVSPFNRDVGVLCHLQRFEEVMRDFPEWKIVISSSWREEFTLDVLRDFFSTDIAARVIGVTPIVLSNGDFLREVEIRQYLSAAGPQTTPWLALDDAAHGFQDKSHLVLCSPEIGFDDVAAKKLRNELTVKTGADAA
ncbi:MAG: HAD domain-containing protein [Sideroxyarcus sp.]|nr:HAD domain-containing protein [Sideroxyarcus sp.]